MNNETSKAAPVTPSGVSRRRLVRAGLAAAPVMAALKSNTVLAGDHTCIRPSSFSSLTAALMKVSKGRTIKDDYRCYSHGFWKNNNAGSVNDAYKTGTKFISSTTGFTVNPSSAFTNKSILEVLNMGGGGVVSLARHIGGTYLTAVAFSNDPNVVMITKEQCVAIWNGQGVWSPFAGTTWDLTQTLAYFDAIYGAKFL